MNNKGFTLIEMLVVIAIIAILVAIIIPTVMHSTDKAAAATNAANLRSYKAELTTALLAGDDLDAIEPPVSKEYGDLDEGVDATYEQDDETGIYVSFGEGFDIEFFAGEAGSGSDD